MVIWSSSANQTQSLKKRKVRCRSRSPRKDVDESREGVAQSRGGEQRRNGAKVAETNGLKDVPVYSCVDLSRTECVRIEV